MKIPERYTVLEQLGHPTPGEWPRTWLTMDRATLEETVFHAAPRGAEGSRLFRRSVARARELSSPYLPPIVTTSRRDETPFVAYPWIPGISLYRLIRRQPLHPEVALVVAWELTSALASLHAAGLPHGDIHPGNFRVTRDGKIMLVGFMPAPFGVPDASCSLDATVRRYGPPEFNDGGMVSAAGDVYSLGLVLFELFAGKALLPRGHRRKTFGHQEKLQRALSEGVKVSEEIPERIEPILRSMLQFDRKKRPRSAVAVLASLERSQAGGFRGKSLAKVLRRPLRKALNFEQRTLEKTIRDRLAHGENLAAATACRSLGELGKIRDRRTSEIFEETVRDLLWLTFAPPTSPETRDQERSMRRVWVLQLYRATGHAQLDDLHAHCRRRLEQLVDDPAAISRNLEDFGLEMPPNRWRGELRRILEGHPGDMEAALELAVEAPTEAGPPGGNAPEISSSFLQKQNLPGAALYHEIRELSDRGRDRDLMKRLAGLAMEAATAAGTTPPGLTAPPEPEPVATEIDSSAGPLGEPSPSEGPSPASIVADQIAEMTSDMSTERNEELEALQALDALEGGGAAILEPPSNPRPRPASRPQANPAPPPDPAPRPDTDPVRPAPGTAIADVLGHSDGEPAAETGKDESPEFDSPHSDVVKRGGRDLKARDLSDILGDALTATPPRWEKTLQGVFQEVEEEDAGPPSVPALNRHLDPTSSTIFEDAAVLFSEGQILVIEGKLDEAAELFHEILHLGEVERERFHAPICAEVRKLLWIALAQDSDEAQQREGLERLLLLTETLDLEDLTHVAERLVVGLLSEKSRSKDLRDLLQSRKTSIPLLQAQLDDAEATGDVSGQYHSMVSLAWQLLEMGEITPATRLFARAKALGVDSPLADQGLARIFEAGSDLARASAAYRMLEKKLAMSSDVEDAQALLEEFLGMYPGFLPGLERYAQVCLQAGDALESARINMTLARRALVRGEPERARERFREVLRAEPDRDESLIYLASIEPPGTLVDGDLEELKLQLLEREGLYETAIHLARKNLKGDARDLKVHARLSNLCRSAGLDPTSHLIAQGVVQLEGGEHDVARCLFEEALEETPDPNSTVDMLLALPGIETIYSRLELVGRKRDEEDGG